MASPITAERTSFFSLSDYVRALFAMTKPTITLLVVVTTIPAIFLASEGSPNTFYMMITLLGAAGASGSAAIFNQVVEKDVDLQMKRTRARSLPTKKISTGLASIVGAILGIVSLGTLYFVINPLTALIALGGHIFYVVIYTMYLKKRTPQNIVIGGVSGAVGPLIGCASVTGSLSLTSWLLFLIIVLWTPPHFWALSLKYKKDYAQAGIPMYPVVYGDERTRWVILLYTLSLFPCIIALGYLADLYLVTTFLCLGLSLKFTKDAYTLYKSQDNIDAMPLFYFSCLYTFALFIFLACDRIFLNIWG